ncbi:MAG: iron ABC transporter permease [Clostridia bacterium]|nr:iron ABC transporter permease [Clostridia bacterium]
MQKNRSAGTLSLPVKVLLLIIPFLAVFISLFFGRFHIPLREVAFSLIKPESVPLASRVAVLHLRLPRAIASAFVGASLAVSGAAFQSVFRNPLVNSGILGVSNGAGFGACVAIVFFGGGVYTYILSFIFAVAAVLLSYFAGRISRVTTSITMILGGVIVGAFFSALVSIMKYVADPYSQLPSITFWFMGSFASINYSHLYALIPMGLGMLLIFLSRWKLNVLSMGEREAASLGLDVRKAQILIIGGATLCTAAAVCISGTIGWVGLVIPHIGRMLTGNSNQKLIPVSISLGAAFMVIMDLLSRTLTGSEIPIGILCALIGTPFFVYLLKKTKGGFRA